MKEEFTTQMHADMLSGEESESNMKLCGAYGAMQRLDSLEKALAEYGVDYDDFIKGIVKALGRKEKDREMVMKSIAPYINK